MVRVDADFVSLQIKRPFTVVERSQFVVALQIRPAPELAVDDVRESFAM